jgi:chemotaxis response regulator CheB
MGSARLTSPPAIRVLLIDIPKMLAEILRSLLADRPDMMLVGEATDDQTNLDVLVELEPDVVIVGLPDSDIPAVCVDLLMKRPGIRIIGIGGGGSRGVVYELRPNRIALGEISPRALIGLIRDSGSHREWLLSDV